MNDTLVINGLAGKKTLKGTIAVGGAKNEALKTLAASLLFDDQVTIGNVPDIEDIHRMVDLLRELGADIAHSEAHTYAIQAPKKTKTALSPNISKRMRASIVLSGPLLARYGSVSFPHPGGCVIGERPIDIFAESFEAMGATVTRRKGMYIIRAPRGLSGAEIFFRVQSVTGTETMMMAAVLAKGTTVIKNAAMEPEIVSLAEFLNASGARITGAGTPVITIKGNGLLYAKGKKHTTIPDRIEAGSFLILAALAGKDVTITRCEPRHIEALTHALQMAGVAMEIGKSTIRVTAGKNKRYRAVDIKTHEYPGFPTDVQAPMTVFLTQTHGESLVFETIWESRLNYTEALMTMGADITMMDPHRVLVRGVTPLKGRKLESPDLRAGLAYIIAAIIADGQSVIHNMYYVDRGYERIEKRLSKLGVSIERIS